MREENKITFIWKKWMTFALVGCVTFSLSYLMAYTSPPNSEGMATWHVFASIGFGLAAAASSVCAFLEWLDD